MRVNKEAIVREITQMGSLPATGALPPGMPGYDPDLQGYSYDPTGQAAPGRSGVSGRGRVPGGAALVERKAESTMAELAAYQGNWPSSG